LYEIVFSEKLLSLKGNYYMPERDTFHHGNTVLSEGQATGSPEQTSVPNTAVQESDRQYEDYAFHHQLMCEVTEALGGKRDITYVPFVPDSFGYNNITSVDRNNAAVKEALKTAGAVICVGREIVVDPNHDPAFPERNTTDTASARSNVATSSELFHEACKLGNEDVKVIPTAWMHNRYIDMMFALPVLAEAAGVNVEDVTHISEEQMLRLLADKDLGIFNEVAKQMQVKSKLAHQAFHNIMAKRGVDADNNYEVAKAFLKEYKSYPRTGESVLMKESALEHGVPADRVIEEPDSVDTNTNLLNVATAIENGVYGFEFSEETPLVIVAGQDHLPRTMWIADKIFPPNVPLVFVESDAALPDKETLHDSCNRELASFRKGREWLRNVQGSDYQDHLEKLEHVIGGGYFGNEDIPRKNLAKLAKEIQEEAAAR